ncbi:MAG: cation-translocating P-type ATPase [Candidatus Heimdallarchaeaceae archaeon]
MDNISCPHAKTLEELEKLLDTDLKLGLSPNEVIKRLEEIGKNVIPPVKGSFWEVWISPLLNWLINIYLIISFIMIILAFWVPSAWSQVSMWLGVIAFNIIFIIIQQVRAQYKLDALHKLSAPISTVIRDGMIIEIPAQDLVPGDIIQLDQGDRVPADARIIQAYNLLVNESALTGESTSVEKWPDGSIILEPDRPISLRSNMVFLGTFVERGKAIALVTNTGVKTELGRISAELQEVAKNEIPIRAKVNRLAKWLGIVVVLFLLSSVIYKSIMYAISGEISNVSKFIGDIVVSITTSMAIMPISIPLLTTLILLTGVLAMAKHRIIVRNLASIETLGRCSVLCTDKTGTITTNQMTIQRVWDTEQLFGVSGVGYGPEGSIYPIATGEELQSDETNVPEAIIPFTQNSSLYMLLIGGLLNNDAHLVIDDVFEPEARTSWKTTGDPTDGAFLAFFNKSGLNADEIRKEYTCLNEFPFDSIIKRMSKVFEHKDGRVFIFCKGATETVLPLCSAIGTEHPRTLTEKEKAKIQDYVNEFAKNGYRVISLAYKELTSKEEGSLSREELEKDLIYNGFVCMLDPPRFGVDKAVEECFQAGVTPIMITGDSALTAEAIAKQIGLMKENDKTCEGNQIENLSHEDFVAMKVFARVSPQHKQIIVEKYQGMRKVVAMCGDGVNDALSLTVADIGLAMGITGTDVAKQASDIVIADDSFISIVRGIREGRGLFEKIRIMIYFYITMNIAEAIIYFAASYILNFSLLNNFQRIYIFSIAHVFPPLAIVFDAIAREIMQYPPRDDEEIFNKRYIIAIAVFAVSLAAVSGLVYMLAYFGYIPVYRFNETGIEPIFNTDGNILNPNHWYHAKARTMFLTVLVVTESIAVFSIRRFNKSTLKSLKEDYKLIVFILILIVPIGHIIVMYATPLQMWLMNTFGVNIELLPLNIIDWLIILGLTAIPLMSLELLKWIVRKRKVYF